MKFIASFLIGLSAMLYMGITYAQDDGPAPAPPVDIPPKHFPHGWDDRQEPVFLPQVNAVDYYGNKPDVQLYAYDSRFHQGGPAPIPHYPFKRAISYPSSFVPILVSRELAAQLRAQYGEAAVTYLSPELH